jgi:hypothetical protein
MATRLADDVIASMGHGDLASEGTDYEDAQVRDMSAPEPR